MKKVLYIDIPFAKERGGDKNRSRFLWDILSKNCEADLLILEKNGKKAADHSGFKNIFTLPFSTGAGLFPESIYSFSENEESVFAQILKNGRYHAVVIRFLSPSLLGKMVEKYSQGTRVIIDVDMLFSRIADLSWEKNRSLKNRFYFFEKYKLKRFERKIFQNSWDFLFTNAEEMNFITGRTGCSAGKFSVLPNVIQGEKKEHAIKENMILFFGTLNSAANEDAFRYLVEEIYPEIEPVLKKHGTRIVVAGKNKTGLYEDLKISRKAEMIDLRGEVENIDETIGSALFTFLPLRVASGTRTRILESALNGKAVLTTKIGAEGLDFSEREICFAQTPELIKEEMKKLISDEGYRNDKAAKLQERAYRLYSERSVGDQLMEKINRDAEKRLNVLLVLNRFYPEVGGAETNLYFQANKMVQKFAVTVFTPLRMAVSKSEILNGYRVKRFFDVLNFRKKYPVLDQKTFCPGMFFSILFGKYDIIQCFPAVNYNNMLAVIAAKIKKVPVILCSFDLLDYSGIIGKTGSIDPDLLRKYRPDWKRSWFFRQFDHIFAISNREIEFYRQFNGSVSYSPVPVLLEEYSGTPPDPRSKYGVGKEDFVFLSLGRVSKIKGQDIALDGFIEVADRLKGSKLVFVGREDYEPELITEMKRKIDVAGLNDRVIFTGMVGREEVLGWLKYSDIHVIPVRFMNSGAVVVESWASGTPVIQSDAVDPNLVEDGKNGYFFKTGDVSGLSGKMERSFVNRDKLSEMAENGRKIVEEKYGYDYLIDLYAQKFEELKGN